MRGDGIKYQHITRARDDRGLTNQQLADAACCSVAMLRAVLAGRRKLRLDQAEKLAAKLGMRLSEIPYIETRVNEPSSPTNNSQSVR